MDSGKLIAFSGEYPNHPALKVADRTYSITADDVEFQKISGNQVSISIHLPSNLSADSGANISFYPDLARVFNSVLSVSFSLPQSDWLSLAENNCI